MQEENLIMKILLISGFVGLGSCLSSSHCSKKFEYECRPNRICNHEVEYITCENFEQMDATPYLCQSECKITFYNNNLHIVRTNSFVQMHNLENLFLNETHTEIIERRAFSDLSNMISIHLENNKISKIPKESFVYLKSLKMLNLSNNAIDEIDKEAFSGSNSIKILDISHNKLQIISPEVLEPLHKLETLNLSYNALDKMEENWCFHFHSLNHLILNNNKIRFPANCSSSTYIETISLSSNLLENLTHAVFPKYLKELYLNNNSISLLNSLAFDLKNLTSLNLSNNKLSIIPFGVFRNLKALSTLDISRNAIEVLEDGILFGSHDLQFLNLSHNKIIQLDPRIFLGMVKLTDLDVSYNNIGSLDTEYLLNFSPEFKVLRVDGNKFTCSKLADLIYKASIKKVLVADGLGFDNRNINGIACLKDSNEISKQNFQMSNFTDQNTIKHLVGYIQNLDNINHNNNLKNNFEELVNNQKNLSKIISSELHSLVESEKKFFQKFLAAFSSILYFKNGNDSRPEQLQTNTSGNNSVREYFEKLMNFIKESKSETDLLEKKYGEQFSNAYQTSAALKSQDNNRLDNMATMLYQIRLFFIACIMVFIIVCTFKFVIQFKNYFKTNTYNMQESQELPFFEQQGV